MSAPCAGSGSDSRIARHIPQLTSSRQWHRPLLLGRTRKNRILQRTACCNATRRELLTASGILLSQACFLKQASCAENEAEIPGPTAGIDSFNTDFSQQGPYTPLRLPKLEHCASSAFPACMGNRCLLRVTALYPKPAPGVGTKHPYPLAILSGGFMVPGAKYLSYAEHLASWGYVVLLYDKLEAPTLEMKFLTDAVCVSFVQDLISWSTTHAVLKQLVDLNEGVMLVGHSRGAKVSVLAAVLDDRVTQLCLLDPVDNTKYAPLGVGFPSAVDALRQLGMQASPQRPAVPMVVIGTALSADCAPRDANYSFFYEASTGATWQVLIPDAGHFQFLDEQSMLDRSVCTVGRTPDATVRAISRAAMVSWAVATSRMRHSTNPSERAVALDLIGGQLQSLLQRDVVLTTKHKYLDIY